MRALPEKEGAAAKRPLSTTHDLAPGTITPGPVVTVLRDAHARVTRAREAILDGDTGFAEHVLDDLGADLWRVSERAEREAQ